MKLYPLKFNPVYSYRIWGGEKLKTVLNKKYTEENIGESWEISDIEGDETKVANGSLVGKTLKELIKEYKSDFVGQSVYDRFGEEFPLLIKFIDAKTPLSIQVHPSDEIAKQRHNSFGKNEMWYVMEAEENAELIVGFNKKIEKTEYVNHLKNSKLHEILNVEKVKKGDTYYIPTGRVHAIGAGVLLAEIQQTSNVTYRIYDYDRIDDKTGEKRELHTGLALDAIDYNFHDNYKTKYDRKENTSNKLVYSNYFKSNYFNVQGSIEKDFSELDSFVIYICVEGVLDVEYEGVIFSLNKGETILFPASVNKVKLVAFHADLLEVYL